MNKIIGQISVTILFLIVGTVRTSTAETLVVGEGLTQTISIPSGEAIVIDFVGALNNSPIYQGERLSVAAVREGTAFAGPSSLIFANSTVVTFSRIRSSEFRTLILNSAQYTYVTNTVIVPEKKSIRIYPTSGGGAWFAIRSGIHSVRVNPGLGVGSA